MSKLSKQAGQPFTAINNELFADKRLSAKAKWLYGYLYSKPDNRDFACSRIAEDFKDGTDAIQSGMVELEKTWWITRKKRPNGKVDYEIKRTCKENYIEVDLWDWKSISVWIDPITNLVVSAEITWTAKPRLGSENNPEQQNPVLPLISKKESINYLYLLDKIYISYIDNIIKEEYKKEIIYKFYKDRKDRGQKMTETALKMFVNRLLGMWKTNDDYLKLVDHAIERGRKTVYAIKEFWKWFEKPKPTNAHELWTSSREWSVFIE